MVWKFITLFVGVVLTLLGILWFLQGSDLIHLKPILCFADCQPIVGKSPQWQYTGAVAFAIGAVIIGMSSKCINRLKK